MRRLSCMPHVRSSERGQSFTILGDSAMRGVGSPLNRDFASDATWHAEGAARKYSGDPLAESGKRQRLRHLSQHNPKAPEAHTSVHLLLCGCWLLPSMFGTSVHRIPHNGNVRHPRGLCSKRCVKPQTYKTSSAIFRDIPNAGIKTHLIDGNVSKLGATTARESPDDARTRLAKRLAQGLQPCVYLLCVFQHTRYSTPLPTFSAPLR